MKVRIEVVGLPNHLTGKTVDFTMEVEHKSWLDCQRIMMDAIDRVMESPPIPEVVVAGEAFHAAVRADHRRAEALHGNAHQPQDPAKVKIE